MSIVQIVPVTGYNSLTDSLSVSSSGIWQQPIAAMIFCGLLLPTTNVYNPEKFYGCHKKQQQQFVPQQASG